MKFMAKRRRRTAFSNMVPGLADPACVSLQSAEEPKRYLRNSRGRLRFDPPEDSELFRKDATFKKVKGLASEQGISFESVNYPGSLIRHRNGELWKDDNDGSDTFSQDATFLVMEAKTRPAASKASRTHKSSKR